MPRFIPVEDSRDPRLAAYVNLRHARAASLRGGDSSRFIAEGNLVVQRLIESDYTLESVLIQAGRRSIDLSMLPDDLAVYEMPGDAISEVVGFDFHRGVLACGRRNPIPSVADYEFKSGGNKLAIGLLGVSEQENLGSILRTAAALGINRVILGPRTIDPLSRRVIRVSMATALKHQYYRMTDSVAELPLLQQRGVKTIASTLAPSASPLGAISTDDQDTLLLIGNEATGISADVLSVVNHCVRIPMQLEVDSLNAAAAAAILMYHFVSD